MNFAIKTDFLSDPKLDPFNYQDLDEKRQPTDNVCGSSHNDFPITVMLQSDSGHFRGLFWANKLRLTVYWLVFLSFGMCVGFLGPTLWDLGCQTSTVIPTMAWLFFSQSLFVLIGSSVAGLLTKLYNPHVVLLCGIGGIGSTLVAVASCRSLTSLSEVLAVMGFCMGLIDTTANVSVISIFKADCSPFIQALHFFYGLGAFLSPLIAEPFLRDFDCTTLIDNTTAATSWIEKAMAGARKRESLPSSLDEAQRKIRVNKAFYIMALMQVPILAVIVLLLMRDYCTNRQSTVLSTGSDRSKSYQDLDRAADETGICWHLHSRNVSIVILLSALLLFLADGMQASFGDYIFSYGRLTVPAMDSSDATLINAGFWGTFALGRLLSIFIAFYVSPSFMLTMDALGSLMAVVIILLFPASMKSLIFGTLLFGLFLSSIYPSTISTAEQFFDIGPSSTSIMVVGAAVGEMVYPLLIGQLLVYVGPEVYPMVCVCTMVLLCFILIILLYNGVTAHKSMATQNFWKLLCPLFFLKSANDEEKISIQSQKPIDFKQFRNDSSPSAHAK